MATQRDVDTRSIEYWERRVLSLEGALHAARRNLADIEDKLRKAKDRLAEFPTVAYEAKKL
jgi:hypothetical protein